MTAAVQDRPFYLYLHKPTSPQVSSNGEIRLQAQHGHPDLSRTPFYHRFPRLCYSSQSPGDYVAWLTLTLDGLHLDRVSLPGMSFGGWLALRYTVAAPERVQKLVLLSPGGFLPIAKQFSLRGMLMVFLPTRFTVNAFMRWAGFPPNEPDAQRVCHLMYLGMKHFRMSKDTLSVAASPLSDDG